MHFASCPPPGLQPPPGLAPPSNQCDSGRVDSNADERSSGSGSGHDSTGSGGGGGHIFALATMSPTTTTTLFTATSAATVAAAAAAAATHQFQAAGPPQRSLRLRSVPSWSFSRVRVDPQRPSRGWVSECCRLSIFITGPRLTSHAPLPSRRCGDSCFRERSVVSILECLVRCGLLPGEASQI